MLIASGTVLVLCTWAVCVLSLMSIGLLPALALQRCKAGASAAPILRTAMWWGLILVTVFAYLANLAWPLHASTTAALGVLLVVILAVPGWVLFVRRRPTLSPSSHHPAMILLWVALALSMVYLAAAALGPVTNYDSGLYHLGSIKYAADFPTVPGLANLYYALGYGNAEFPLAALLGNGPWQGEGYRLLNGLVMGLAVVDLGMRSHARRLGPGFFTLAAGVLAAWIPMVALSDYWVTSPTQDSSVFIVTVVATAYLAEAARAGDAWLAEATTASVLGVLLVLLRPTMAVFAVAIVILTAILARRRRGSTRGIGTAAALFAAVTVLSGIAATLRDVVLSGWLQFPLSVHAFDVPWLAADPTMDRTATLGFHRNPNDLWGSTSGWAWVGPWLAGRIRQWETYELLGLVIVALALAHVADRAVRPNTRWRAMLMAWAPSAVATTFWWLATPPSYRFAWGPLFTMATIPIGWSLWLLCTREHSNRIPAQRWLTVTAVAVAVPILLVTGYSAAARFHTSDITSDREWRFGISVPYAVAPVVDVPVQDVPTDTGLVLRQPTASDQCWDHYPLCTPRPTPTLRLRGAGIASGFLP